MLLRFGPWQPDTPDNDDGSAVEATGVVPGYGGAYEPQSGLQTFSNSLSARCQGAFACKAADGAVFWFAGDRGDLFALSSVTWSNVSVVGGYSVSSDGSWSFAQYGDAVYAADYNDTIQVYTLGAGGSFSPVASAPRARRLFVVANFLVALNTVDSGTPNPQRVRWSGLDQPLSWTVDSVTQADFQDLYGAGGQNMAAAVGLVGADAAIFQQRGVWRMTYAGLPLIFEFAQIEGVRGTPAPKSLITIGGLCYYLAENGFAVFDGNTSESIGAGKVDRFFASDANPARLYRTSGVADTDRKLLFWAYVSNASVDGNCDRILVYNYVTGWWSLLKLAVELLWQTLSFGYTLDQLDAFYGANIDAFPVSFDSAQWQGGLHQLSAFDTGHRTSHFSGAPLGASLVTSENLMPDPHRYLTVKAWPVVECRSATADVAISIGHRSRAIDAVTWGASIPPNNVGFSPQRVSDHYNRYRLSISASTVWARAVGIDIATGSTTQKR